MNKATDDTWPAWLGDVDSLLAVHPHFVLWDNVRDWYRLPVSPFMADSVGSALAVTMAPSGYDVLLRHDVVDGYSVIAHDSAAGWAAVHAVTGLDLRSADRRDLGVLAEVLRALAREGSRRLAFMLDYASQLAVRTNELQANEHDLFRVATKMSHDAKRITVDRFSRDLYNPVFWLVQREHDLPAWYTAGNPGVRTIQVPRPDLAERQRVSHMLLGRIDPAARAAVAEKVAAATDGLGISSLRAITTLFVDRGLGYDHPEDAVRIYKVGGAESPWRKGEVSDNLRGNAQRPDGHTFLSARILGQDRAVTKAVDILTRAVLGLSGAQASRSSSRPRGVLFFVGPTGSGKTELAKSMTELIFGDAEAYVRFDMSEFSAEHTGERLVGAPPGFVGFDAGGELTNAVRRKPYSLLLFDEVEKAHPLILDKFLQVLEDGRLTDGRGTTVHFSENLIVFTSNLGTYKLSDDGTKRIPNIKPGERYEVIEKKVRDEVHEHFTVRLNRPELLNRIGDNIVVFDFISAEVGRLIVDQQVGNVIRRVQEAAGITVSLKAPAHEALRSLATADLSFGGRGIGNVVESAFVNPLARALFARNARAGDKVSVCGLREGSGGPEVLLQ